LSPTYSLPFALFLLTAITGIVDAVSFLGLGRVFTANMTGNVVLLGFPLTGAPGVSVSRSSVALLAFFLGAVAGGRLAESVADLNRRRWLVRGRHRRDGFARRLGDRVGGIRGGRPCAATRSSF
jgi:uncharacterized membrane protein YoaK (UPF0700 family)